jgi:predicted ester cyclase
MRLPNRLFVFALLGVTLACAPETEPEIGGHKDLVLGAVQALNDRDLERLDELMTPDFVRHSQAVQGVEVDSLEVFKRLVEADWIAFPDSRMHIRLLVAEEDLVAVYGSVTGTQDGPMGPFAASGKRMELDFGGVFRVEEGKLAELWITWDNLATLRQLGHLHVP